MVDATYTIEQGDHKLEVHRFLPGKQYRRQELLDFVGSRQAQSGVIWGPMQPGCVICTSGGRHGKKVGYFDEQLSDGSWQYFGQGGKGDQNLSNAANSKLASGDRSILLFTSREPTTKEIVAQSGYGKLFTFQGDFIVANAEVVLPEAGPRKGDQLLRFYLVRAEGGAFQEELRATVADVPQVSMSALREQLSAENYGPATVRLGLVEYRRRSVAVHRYARLRASGFCELCLEHAPFNTRDGIPYLEVHHIHRLADDGPDAPQNVAAICPNCHRAVHYAHNRLGLNAVLAEKIALKERDLSKVA